jgi:hypothetical protein
MIHQNTYWPQNFEEFYTTVDYSSMYGLCVDDVVRDKPEKINYYDM